jgi:hypothetical protein
MKTYLDRRKLLTAAGGMALFAGLGPPAASGPSRPFRTIPSSSASRPAIPWLMVS